MITDQYDVPRYKEINPTLFSCITFPFLFGMMYGDICHGACIFIVGCLLVLCHHLFIESKGLQTSDSPLAGMYAIRYMLILLGLFSTFCGFMYNDFTSIPLEY